MDAELRDAVLKVAGDERIDAQLKRYDKAHAAMLAADEGSDARMNAEWEMESVWNRIGILICLMVNEAKEASQCLPD